MSVIKWCLQKFGIGKRGDALTPSDAEALRTAFRSRYHNFKLLLSANNKALQVMSDLEDARKGDRPIGMSFVRAHCTAASVNVFRMVKCMEQLAPGKYSGLGERFRAIQGCITEILSERKDAGEGPFVIRLDQVDKSRADDAGNKMANLGEIRNHLGVRVPNGFVITSHGFREFIRSGEIQSEIDRIVQASAAEEMDQLFELSAELQQLVIRASVPEGLRKAIMEAYAELEKTDGRGVRVSLRSSALGEDSADTSFAGQYRSELNVSPENIIEAYKEIVASKYSLQAIAYRLNKGIRDEDVDMCVGCIAMVDALSGGVVYTRNPLNVRDDRVFIHSVWGLPKSVVDGSVASDRVVVARGDPPRIEEKLISDKRQKFVCYPDEGVCRMEITGEEGAVASVSEPVCESLTGIALRIEQHYNCAQDIEWALDEAGGIVILQCRPLRQAGRAAAGKHPAPDIPSEDVLLSGGVAASPGAGCGPVCVVKKDSDALGFPKGGVLVVRQALPRWAALLSRATALVAEQGSAAGHLANVAREFGVPALFGVEEAADRLENGVVVSVDADGLGVYRGKVEALQKSFASGRSLMEGSTVFRILARVSDHIIPLYLLDPDGSDFKPACCRTFHDITRFCHENAVNEMFRFGKDHHFSERASKQLWHDIPMQWWVLNLDDGFNVDVEGKFVKMENIASIPMLALWEGIVAVPWEGPPPVDSKGFMAILMEASSNPNLDPSMPSPYANRNYFMISKNFCSLSSRFGFHYSTIEALVGERDNENYISFGFKGGAADQARRVRRAKFVGEILEEFEFRSEVRNDGVNARIEGYPEDVMREKLRILGYLLMHTRQLDMVMFNDASCQHHKAKVLKDISSVILNRPSGDSETAQAR
ncbi:MAG: pyruvate, water dikinase [Desulfobacteraceae bacterium]|nr:pyruvate, water dikinase [Desulfobacteraceae bacterium]